MSPERRAWPRENLAFRIQLADGSMAVTRNVSAGGLFLIVSSPMLIGERLSFEFDMPDIGLKFIASSQVVRVEGGEQGTTGVAVRLDDGRIVPH